MISNGAHTVAKTDDDTMFIVIGAQKAGTTWLHGYLSHHPDVSCGPLKEYHYFNKFHKEFAQPGQSVPFHALRRVLAQASMLRRAGIAQGYVGSLVAALRGQGDYMTLVRGSDPQAKVFGDVTPIYSLLGRDAFAEMAQAHSDVRFVFIMRDPVERLWSHTRMRARRLKLTPGGAEFDRLIHECLDDPRFLGRSDYTRTVTELEAVVARDHILYLFYEDLFSDQSLERLCAYLGIGFKPGQYDEKVFAGMVADAPEGWLHEARKRLAPVYNFVSDRFGADVPAAWGAGPMQMKNKFVGGVA